MKACDMCLSVNGDACECSVRLQSQMDFNVDLCLPCRQILAGALLTALNGSMTDAAKAMAMRQASELPPLQPLGCQLCPTCGAPTHGDAKCPAAIIGEKLTWACSVTPPHKNAVRHAATSDGECVSCPDCEAAFSWTGGEPK